MRKQKKMGLFDKLKNAFKKPEPEKVIKDKKPKEKKPELSEKEKATLAGEPYVAILSVEIDPNNVNSGSFELDWNDLFIAKLIKAGYMKKKEDTDQDIIDRWYQQVCRNVALEMYEQQQADPDNREFRNVRTKDLGNGRTEVS
jgi:hypothetical protein